MASCPQPASSAVFPSLSASSYQQPITTRDVAREAGVHQATVSRALHDDPRISHSTRERIQKLARSLGYTPDPMLSALMVYRRSKTVPRYQGTLAWIINEGGAKGPTPIPLFRLYHEGACWRAASLGFQVEQFHLGEPGMTPARMSEILLARGIQGILVAPQPQPNTKLEMRWEWFSSVTFGFSLSEPQLHLVSSTQYRIGMAATQKLQELGYQRIGFLAAEAFDQRTDRNFTAGFYVASRDVPAHRRVPPLLTKHPAASSRTSASVRRWVARWRLDAVVCVNGMHPLLIEAGFRIPDDLAVALVGIQAETPGFAGIDEQGFRIGTAAVDSVVGMIHRGERGVPDVPYRLLIEGRWVDGASAPPNPACKPTRRRLRLQQNREAITLPSPI